jgi:hypothetical protein
MSTPNFTPGPWFAFDDEIVAERGDTHIAQATLYDSTNPTEWQANLHLLAAAPDLYAALKALRDQSYGNPATPHEAALIDLMADAALAKAEGR